MSTGVSHLECTECEASGAILNPEAERYLLNRNVMVHCPYCGAPMSIVRDASLASAVTLQALSAQAHPRSYAIMPLTAQALAETAE
jgi:hypothetical protein